MDSLPLAMLLATRSAHSTARSALPDAPVVPERASRRSVVAVRPRLALARGLRRLAAAVAPDGGRTTCVPAS